MVTNVHNIPSSIPLERKAWQNSRFKYLARMNERTAHSVSRFSDICACTWYKCCMWSQLLNVDYNVRLVVYVYTHSMQITATRANVYGTPYVCRNLRMYAQKRQSVTYATDLVCERETMHKRTTMITEKSSSSPPHV